MLKDLLLNIKSQADLAAFESANESISGLADGARGLSQMFDQLARSGAGAEKMDLGKMLGSAQLIKQAWDLGSQIGDAIGGAITRVGQNGFSLSTLLGGYDPRNDPTIAAMRDRLFELRNQIEQPPARIGLVDALKQIEAAADAAISKLEHLRQLESIGQDEDRRIQREALDAREGMIKDSTQLSPEEKEAQLAEVEKERIRQEAAFRREDRFAPVEDAEQAESEASKALFETDVASSRAIDEQRKRKQQADEPAAKALQDFAAQGGPEANPEGPEKFVQAALEKQGLRTPEQEQQELNQLIQDREKNLRDRRDELEKARIKRERTTEIANAKQKVDDTRTTEQIRGVDTALRGKRFGEQVTQAQAQAGGEGERDRAAALAEGQAKANPPQPQQQPQAQPSPAPSASSGRQAQAVAQQVSDSSNKMSAEITQVAQTLLQSNQQMVAAVTNLANAVQSVTQSVQKAEQMAAAALQVAQQGRAQTRSYNR
jgi:hypothetical protein